ncbi:hypothetical protein EYF80_031795 [Liparis tanakae]|uniref:Uncharacterized protein n=1 Tax=Liparis tanakae TaxID=230148 RepID=A0A4Z2GXD1_9TELE|nr:hypothetical protein EYF80_031795 [Liparis tanakae]
MREEELYCPDDGPRYCCSGPPEASSLDQAACPSVGVSHPACWRPLTWMFGHTVATGGPLGLASEDDGDNSPASLKPAGPLKRSLCGRLLKPSGESCLLTCLGEGPQRSLSASPKNTGLPAFEPHGVDAPDPSDTA